MPTKSQKSPKPRSRGRIEQRGPDKFLVRVYTGKDERTGKRLYTSKTITGPRKDAEKELTRILRETDTHTYVAPSKKTLEAYLNAWLVGKRGISSVTKENYSRDIARITAHIGSVHIERLSKEDVGYLYDQLEKDGLSPNTIRHVHATLRQAVLNAIDSGYIVRSPLRGVELPKAEDTQVNIITPEQVDRLLEATRDTPLGPLWALALTCGLRPQELVVLQWSDFDGESLFVQRALVRVRVKGHWRLEVGPTKTAKSRRRIRVPAGTIALLEEHRARQLRAAFRGETSRSPEGYIFATKNGSFINPVFVRRKWHEALKVCGIEDTRLYDARHSHATHLLMAGKSPKVVAERLGHTTTKITMDTYSHVLPEIESDAVEAIDELIFRREKKAG